MTNSFSEFARAKMIMVIGSNMVEAHPVAATFVKNAVLKGAQLIVVDPRRHALADLATRVHGGALSLDEAVEMGPYAHGASREPLGRALAQLRGELER